ncbi:MAG: methyltransferase [Myxococcaceae bacterium]|nr:methyltransferase [Myxococcaceae bacterium]
MHPTDRLQGETPERLAERFGAALRPEEARRIVAHVVQRGGDSLLGVQQLRTTARKAVEAELPIGVVTVRERQASQEDPFVKYAIALPDGAVVETVRIPLERAGRYVVCVSSQVGCAMGCAFCATGMMGLARNLEAWEIVEQVRLVAAELRASGEGRVHGVVFQGMGEPLHNLDNVLRAIEVISNPCGLAVDARNVTVCTVGIVPGIERLASMRTRIRLGISITSAQAALRRSLVPMEGKYPIREVVEAARKFHERSGRLVMFAYALMGGVNTTDAEADALAELLKLMPARLSLIDWNPVAGLPYRPPTAEERDRFHDRLAQMGVPVIRRYSGGKDIGAACGQLATESKRKPRGRRGGESVADETAQPDES